MKKQGREEFYYHAAVYRNIELSSEVFHALDTLIKSADYNLSVYRILEPQTNAYAVVVVGETPSEMLDQVIVEHLISTGKLIELKDEVLRTLLGRRPDMN